MCGVLWCCVYVQVGMRCSKVEGEKEGHGWNGMDRSMCAVSCMHFGFCHAMLAMQSHVISW